MAVPDFQSFFKPLLELATDGREHSMKDAREWIANKMELSVMLDFVSCLDLETP
jgi:restriction system protein